MWDVLSALLAAIVPPHDADPTAIGRWRLIIAALVLLNTASIGAHIALACGYVPQLYAGFAGQHELDDTNSVITSLLRRNMSREIVRLATNMCDAMSNGNYAARDFARNELFQTMQDWQSKFGTAYILPSCDEVQSNVKKQ